MGSTANKILLTCALVCLVLIENSNTASAVGLFSNDSGKSSGFFSGKKGDSNLAHVPIQNPGGSQFDKDEEFAKNYEKFMNGSASGSGAKSSDLFTPEKNLDYYLSHGATKVEAKGSGWENQDYIPPQKKKFDIKDYLGFSDSSAKREEQVFPISKEQNGGDNAVNPTRNAYNSGKSSHEDKMSFIGIPTSEPVYMDNPLYHFSRGSDISGIFDLDRENLPSESMTRLENKFRSRILMQAQPEEQYDSSWVLDDEDAKFSEVVNIDAIGDKPTDSTTSRLKPKIRPKPVASFTNKPMHKEAVDQTETEDQKSKIAEGKDSGKYQNFSRYRDK